MIAKTIFCLKNIRIKWIQSEFLFIYLFCFWGLTQVYGGSQDMGLIRELQLQAYTTTTATTMPDQAMSATYTTAHGNARSLTR